MTLYIEMIVKFLMFGISNIGFWEVIRRKCKEINVYFLPSLVIATQVVTLFLAGLLNILEITTSIVLTGGIVCFGYYIIREKSFEFLINYRKIGFVYLVALLAVVAICVHGKIFTAYDNFSHWAVVVRRMLETNRYPNFEDSIIMFQEYPLGSSTYVYYFAKCVGRQESLQMLGQAYVMLACLLPIFMYVRKNRIVSLTFMVLVTDFLLAYSISVTDLAVDTLLPIVSMCMILYVYKYCSGNSEIITFWLAALYMVFVMQIKNSGIFFVIIAVIQLLSKARKGKWKLKRLFIVMIPFVSLYLWQQHCNYVFARSKTSKHAMTIENYKNVFNGKSIEDIKNICYYFIKYVLTWKDIWIAIGCLGGTCVVIFFLMNRERRILKKIVIFNCTIFAFYLLGLLGMYIFSMPLGEAITLASINRYIRTIIIAIIYIMCLVYVKVLSDIKRRREIICACCIILCTPFFMYTSKETYRSVLRYIEDPTERMWFENVKSEYNIPIGEKYCILIETDDYGYAYYLGQYLFETTEIECIAGATEEELNTTTAKYILVYDNNSTIIQKWIADNYPEQKGNKVIERK